MKLIARLFLILLLCTAAAPAAPELPEMGTVASDALSVHEERELGQRLMREVRRHLPLIDDPEIVHYVRDLGQRLSTHSDMPNLDFEFFVVDHSAINAFAMPGGYIGVNSGLLLAAESESELAGVLAHEIAHVTQRHIARQIASAGRTSLQTLAMIMAGLLVGSQDAEAGSAIASAGMATGIQQQLNYSRAFEQEADSIGIRMLSAANLDARGMPAFFDRLLKASRYYARPPEYLSTHPASESRIAETAARAERYDNSKVFESVDFQLMKNKLAVLKSHEPEQLANGFRKRLREAPGDHAARYGLALTAMATNDFATAADLLDELIDTAGELPAYLLARSRLDQEAGRTAAALKRYEQTLALYPGLAPARLQYAQALLSSGKPREAHRELSRMTPSADPQIYWLLARAAAQARLGAEPQLAMAEYHYLRGDLRAALIQLDQALADPRVNTHEAARAAARKSELKRELAKAAEAN